MLNIETFDPQTRLLQTDVKENTKQEEFTLHQDLSKCIQAIEKWYEKELIDPISNKEAFTGVEALVQKYLFRYLQPQKNPDRLHWVYWKG